MNETRLFAYGTLMPGEVRHDLLAGWVSQHMAATVQGWLFGVPAGYPALVLPPHTSGLEFGPPRTVRGVVCVCRDDETLFEALDRYEDYVPGDPGSLYVRVEVDVAVEDGGVVRAWTYIWNPERLHELVGHSSLLPGERWASGR